MSLSVTRLVTGYGEKAGHAFLWSVIFVATMVISGILVPVKADGGIMPAVSGVAPPAIYPADTWQGRSQAVIRVLNRFNSQVETLILTVGQAMQYRSLSMTALSCLERPKTLPSDTATHLTIRDSLAPDAPVSNGWFLEKEPALGGYVSPLYAVSVVACQGDLVAPMVGPLPKTHIPRVSLIAVPQIEGVGDTFDADSGHSDTGRDAGSSPVELPLAAPQSGAQQALPPPRPLSGQPDNARLANGNVLSGNSVPGNPVSDGQDFQEDWMQDNPGSNASGSAPESNRRGR